MRDQQDVDSTASSPEDGSPAVREPATARTATSSVCAVRGAAEALESAGGSSAVLLARLGLSRAQLADPRRRVPFTQVMRAWRLAPSLASDEAFGLHQADRLSIGAFGLVEYAARASGTLAHGIAWVLRYQRLLHEPVQVSLTTTSTQARLGLEIRGVPQGGPRHFTEAALATWLVRARQLTGADLVPLEVRFQHRAPEDVTPHDRLFRAPLRFGCDRTELVFAPAVLELPLRDSDDNLARVLARPEIETNLSSLAALGNDPDDIVSVVRQLIEDVLQAGDQPTTEAIAHGVGLGARTLQRRLTASGAHYRGLLDEARRKLALAWLRDADLSAAQIAYRLGYARPTAFSHTVRRWTGFSVRQLRAGMGAERHAQSPRRYHEPHPDAG
jgi:AraC-like DNA-binding protein